jgi:hypothetical protein
MVFLQLSALASKPPNQYASALAMACQSTARRCDETDARNNESSSSLMTHDVKDLGKP